MSTITKERDTATNKRSDVRKNSKTYYSTSYTRSTRGSNQEVSKQIWTITPELAKELVATNPDGNRRVRRKKVSEYARDMAAGDWDINGHEISITKEGVLIDGQHRMLAVIEANMDVDFWVALNVPATTQFDVGASRSAADSMRIGRMLNNPDLATSRVVGMVNAFYSILYSRKPTNHQIAHFIDGHEDDIIFIFSLLGTNGSPVNRAPVSASFLAAIECGVERAVISSFAEEVNSGVVYSPSHSAAAVLRTMILELKFGHGGGRSQDLIASMTCQALRDYAKGVERKKKYQFTKTPYFDDLKKAGYEA